MSAIKYADTIPHKYSFYIQYVANTKINQPLLVSLFFFIAVKSIKKQHLVEVRSMANPPAIVKLALESICLLLGENATDWKSIRAVIIRENFINLIVSGFSTENIT